MPESINKPPCFMRDRDYIPTLELSCWSEMQKGTGAMRSPVPPSKPWHKLAVSRNNHFHMPTLAPPNR
jgi:hypothetical protein